ncbi:hypothetical protein UR09_05215 [Candidatus Nitromaritima sp. SCGC AAA799-A02]|nr:hypothetical protein UR09_05215 [Candidatus Nitromaritima sp. SCGC AAA799-A02]
MNDKKRFQDTASGAIRDTQNDTEWLPKDSYGDLGKWVTLQEALNYAQLMNQVYAGGHSDWRLPNREEALQLFDESLVQKDWEGNDIHIAPIFLTGCSNYMWISEKNDEGQALRIDLRNADLEFTDPMIRDHQGVRLIRKSKNLSG